jgi:hypothetical protein
MSDLATIQAMNNKAVEEHEQQVQKAQGFTLRELALLSLCLQFALSNIDALEEVADENIQGELEQLQARVDK